MVEDATSGDGVSQETILKVLAEIANEYYRLVFAVASAFLGGSLLFLEKFVRKLSVGTLVPLTLGWVALVVAIALIANVCARNIESANLVIRDKRADARKLDDAKARDTALAVWCLVGGMTLLVIAGIVSLWTKLWTGGQLP
jgi:hypothetical protein